MKPQKYKVTLTLTEREINLLKICVEGRLDQLQKESAHSPAMFSELLEEYKDIQMRIKSNITLIKCGCLKIKELVSRIEN